VEKRSYLHHSRNATELELMRTLKQCLDPDNILNPGKVLSVR
jgi:FAD/FMN-containing dehydrogenase